MAGGDGSGSGGSGGSSGSTVGSNSSGGSGGGTRKFDPSDPYFIGSNDNSGNVITSVVFRGDNYEEWSRFIRLSLVARRKFEFVDGTIPKPTDSLHLRDWQCLHALLVQWILNTIDTSVKKTLPYFEEAKPLSDMLRQRFNVGNDARKQQLKAALVECKQPKGMTIFDYFGKLQPLWDEFATYNPIPICKCGGCTCNIGAQLQARADEDWLHDFLYGVNKELYGVVRSTILAYELMPSLDRAYQMFLHEERLPSIAQTQTVAEDIRVMAVRPPVYGGDVSSSRPQFPGDKGSFVCLYCQRKGHEEEIYWSKYGYREWWEHRAPRGGGRRGSACDGRGGKTGQHANDCASAARVRHEGQASVAAVSYPSTNQVPPTGVPGLTTTQWQQLLVALSNSSIFSEF